MTKYDRVKKRLDDEWGLTLIRNSSKNPGWLPGACRTGYTVSGMFPGKGTDWVRYDTLQQIIDTMDRSLG